MSKEKKPWKPDTLVTSAIRKIWSRSPLKAKALELALTNPEEKKYNHLYLCSCCGEVFPLQKVEVNHKTAGFTTETWDQFIDRMFCGVKDVFWIDTVALTHTNEYTGIGDLTETVKRHLEVVCKDCHSKLTRDQRAAAKAAKKGKK